MGLPLIGLPRLAGRGSDWLLGVVSRRGQSLRRGSAAGLGFFGCRRGRSSRCSWASSSGRRRLRGCPPCRAAGAAGLAGGRRGGAAERTEHEEVEAAEK